VPLLDHFHSPPIGTPPWTSIGAQWIACTIRMLNRSLPKTGYRAYSRVHLGNMAEADIAEYELPPADEPRDWSAPSTNDGTATAVLPPPVASFAPIYPDQFAIEIVSVHDGMRIVAVMEFISPSNKDRPGTREQLVDKCVAYLGNGIGVVLVDTITSRRANLSNELVAAFGTNGPQLADCHTYVSSFRPSPPDCNIRQLDMWAYPAEVGQRIPSVPLPLASGPPLMIDLESTYVEACTDLGL